MRRKVVTWTRKQEKKFTHKTMNALYKTRDKQIRVEFIRYHDHQKKYADLKREDGTYFTGDSWRLTFNEI